MSNAMKTATKQLLLDMGKEVVSEFYELNKDIRQVPVYCKEVRYKGGCAYYQYGRNAKIVIDPSRCGNLGKGGPAWSWPGYKIDRTPFGVITHEMGHHVDSVLGEPSRSKSWKSKSIIQEKVSGYEPNAAERFAESFRLWLGNPDLFKQGCPNRYAFFKDLGLEERTDEDFLTVLRGFKAPDRQLVQAKKYAERYDKAITIA